MGYRMLSVISDRAAPALITMLVDGIGRNESPTALDYNDGSPVHPSLSTH